MRNRKHGVRGRGACGGIAAAAVTNDYTGNLVDIARCDGYGGDQGKSKSGGMVRNYFVRCLPCTLALGTTLAYSWAVPRLANVAATKSDTNTTCDPARYPCVSDCGSG
jgi:hypothetical protein